MYSEIIAELRVMGFECSPADITDCLGLLPTSTWVRGEPRSKTGRGVLTHQENGWELASRKKISEESLDFSDLFDDIFKSVIPIKENFRLLPEGTIVCLSCCAYVGTYSPILSLDESRIRLLADINAQLDFDIYCLSRKDGDCC